MPRIRFSGLTGSLVLLLLFASVSSTHAQRWQQEIQIITTIRSGDPIHTFLDSLSSILGRNPAFEVQRSVPDSTSMPYRTLREALYEEGLTLTSASHAFIRYRFNLNNAGEGVIETIEDIYFIYRYDESRSDFPILYLDTRDPEVSDLLLERGIPSPVNMKAFTSFRKLMAFPILNLRHETEVVEFGNRALRNDPAPQQKMLLHRINKHMSVGTYILTTSHQQQLARADSSSPSSPLTGEAVSY